VALARQAQAALAQGRRRAGGVALAIPPRAMTLPRWNGRADPIPPVLRARMTGVSWRPDPRCPPFDALCLLTLDHWDFGGAVRAGRLVAARALADELLAIFGRLFALEFPIERMDL